MEGGFLSSRLLITWSLVPRVPRERSQPVDPKTPRAFSVDWPLGNPAGPSTGSDACKTMARSGRSFYPQLCRYLM